MPRDAFFACYLLTPVAPPQRLRSTYVGFTVSPTRRIRQHNGELVSGAKRTRKYRPWEMIVVVHGFPSKFHALQFEYAWQHPYNCRFTKERLRELQGSKGLGHPRSVKRKLVELHEMLHVAPWQSFPLTVSYTNPTIQNLVRTTAFFQWPAHMTCEVQPLHELAKFRGAATANDRAASASDDSGDGEDVRSAVPDTCYICDEPLATSELQVLTCYHDDCRMPFHSLCLADHFLLEVSMASESNDPGLLRPERGTCPDCSAELLWPLLVRNSKTTPAVSPSKDKGKKAFGRAKKRQRPPVVIGGSPLASPKRPASAAAKGSDATIGKDDVEGNGDAGGSSDCSDSGWFENDDDDLSRYEYVDRFDSADESGGSAIDSHPSTRPDEHAQRHPAPVVVVDLTLDD